MAIPIPLPFRSWSVPLAILLLLVGGMESAMAAEAGQRQGGHRRVKAAVGDPAAAALPSVFLTGTYIKVGMHNAGSFGADNPVAQATPLQLGFLANANGWSSNQPAATGDFFIPGDPEEAWGVTWEYQDVDKSTKTFIRMNAGLMATIAPGYTPVPTDAGYPRDTSAGSQRRALWRGTALNPAVDQALRVIQTVAFDQDDKFFTINVVLTNTGSIPITNLHYMRSVDPDQDADPPVSVDNNTDNYVRFQPPRTTAAGVVLPAIPGSTNKDKALVVAVGPKSRVPLGLGTIDARARVAYAAVPGEYILRDPSGVLDLKQSDQQAMTLSDAKHSASDPSAKDLGTDAAIALAFDLGDLQPSQSVTIKYAYILDENDLDVALARLARVSIRQPQDTVSGTKALFQVSTNNPASRTLKVDLYVGAARSMQVGSIETPTSGLYAATFDSTALANGPVDLEAVATFEDGSVGTAFSSVLVDNNGPPLAFASPTPGDGAVLFGSGIPVALTIDGANPPTSIALFLEYGGTAYPLSTLTPPTLTDSLVIPAVPSGTNLVVKAVATNVNGATTTIYRTVFWAGSADVTSPDLTLSPAAQTIYTAISPSTTQGIASVMAALAGSTTSTTRAFAWDATSDSYVELPGGQTSLVGGVIPETGIFIATRQPLTYHLAGTPVDATYSPYTLTIPSATTAPGPTGWSFVGLPPILVAPDQLLTRYAWPNVTPEADGLRILELSRDNGPNDGPLSAGDQTLMLGDPLSGEPETSRPWWWNSATNRYEQVSTLVCGRSYWIKNNSTDYELTIQISGVQTLGAQGVLDLTTVTVGTSPAAAKAAVAGRAVAPGAPSAGIRNQGTPPAPPGSAGGGGSAGSATPGASSSKGGCGAGSGLGLLSLLLALALAGLRLRTARG